ncbi:PREDICTED: centrosomal protein of 78 kDa-like [Priapulus caudatus]|uniref:Centrosomal protein of 78 kDa-like n=1 Tax=Priapulus caudatus TaxID=37621 RepID=A0ABM1EM11_PRICU|nr:PREDICTED: centrosomal protein of 78 kDa-like [Priapulus caudatus]
MSGFRHLRLNDNPALGDGAARVIADALRDDLWLKVVEMQACGMTSSGVAALADALAVNTTLSVLDVASNDVAAPVLASLRAALQRNSHADMPLEYEELLIAEKAERAHAGTRPATAVRKATGPRDGHAGRAPAARRQVTSTAKKLHAPLSNTRTSSRPKSASARSCGANMARDVTALRSQVAALRAEAAEKEKALSEERRLRVAAERKRDELIADNEFLRREVGSIREEARHARGRGEDDADLADVHATITQFHKFLDLLHTVVPDRR